ncbi:methyltransferase CmcJ [Bombardia bombarda]|uniref:Methyltransferase CmcJ n=1 Tax=Bombardia bombarda TaxID=252184 RepID=A0AA39X825_9PEZI|nr:methyltransferase CmcJ [Bombardia bombarda]
MATSPECEQLGYATHGQIRYLDRLDLYETEKPYEVTFLPVNVDQPGARRTNLKFKSYPVVLRDFSTRRDAFSTDIQGFELDTFPTSLLPSQLKDLATVEELYHPEAVAFLEQKYGATKVFIFDTTIRSAQKPERDASALLRNQQILGLATDCHVDQSPGSVRRRVQHSLPDEAQTLLKQRVRVINIWRPLVQPYHSNPLAMCDWRSTVPQDYTLSDHKTPVWEGESLQVYQNPDHRWWFARDMKEEDVILIKMFDSEAAKPDGQVAMCTPHCSFDWKDAPESTRPRESMEIRAIVFS